MVNVFKDTKQLVVKTRRVLPTESFLKSLKKCIDILIINPYLVYVKVTLSTLAEI